MFVFEIGTLILLSLKTLKTALTPRQAPHCYLAVCNVCLICIDIVRTCMTFVDTTYIYPYKCGCVGEPQHYLQMVNWVLIAIAEGGCTTTTACCGEVLQPRGRDMLPKNPPVNMVPSVCWHNWLLALSVILRQPHTDSKMVAIKWNNKTLQPCQNDLNSGPDFQSLEFTRIQGIVVMFEEKAWGKFLSGIYKMLLAESTKLWRCWDTWTSVFEECYAPCLVSALCWIPDRQERHPLDRFRATNELFKFRRCHSIEFLNHVILSLRAFLQMASCTVYILYTLVRCSIVAFYPYH